MSEFLSLHDAVAGLVRPGDTVALEGFTHLIPFAAGHEVIRQGIGELTLIRMTPDLLYDQMIGCGLAKRLVFSWGGNPGVGSLHRLRDAVERGWPRPIELEEHSHAAMAHAYAAGAANMPAAFFRGYVGSDLAAVNPNIRFIDCPFTGERLAAVPAHRPDVAIVHAQKADRDGNVLLEGIVGVQKEAVLAARRSLVTVEEVVDALPRTSPNAVVLPSWTVTAIAVAPGGAQAVVRARLLRARQRVLRRVGRHLARSRNVPGLDRRARPVAIGRGRVMSWTAVEMMTVSAARALADDDVCFVGIGLPSAACNLARLTHAPRLRLVYESGTIETRPDVLPLSIGDGELCETALTTVSVPEMFQYWLQGGRITIGFLGGAQVDRFGNLNSTVIGDYARPTVRLPGGGGAPEIAACCRRTFIVMRHSRRAFVDRLAFVTTLGHGPTGQERRALGLTTEGPVLLVSDLCIMRPHPETKELQVTSLHPGVTREQVVEQTGWPVAFAGTVVETPAPTARELEVLRDLQARTAAAHGVAPAE